MIEQPEHETERLRAASRRHAARLAAVQALYQIELSEGSPETVVSEFLQHRLGGASEESGGAAVDTALFEDLVRGVTARREELDRQIAGTLAEGWRLDRLDAVVLAVLRAGTYELAARTDIPARVSINEFVDVTHAFFAGKEPGFVNGVLDRLARSLRAAEMEKPAGEPCAHTG